MPYCSNHKERKLIRILGHGDRALRLTKNCCPAIILAEKENKEYTASLLAAAVRTKTRFEDLQYLAEQT